VKKLAVTMTTLILFWALVPMGAATAAPGDRPTMKRAAEVDRAQRAAVAKAAPGSASAAVAAADITATVTDPTGDTFPTAEPRADLTAGSLSFGEGGPNVTVTVPGGTDPATDPNWDNEFSFIEWDIDTNNDDADFEYVIQAFNFEGEFVAVVFTSFGEFTCDATPEFLPASTMYIVSFDPSCIGNPGAARFFTAFVYDTVDEVFFDVAPEVGVSAAARNDFATAKPALHRDGTWLLRNTLTSGSADFAFAYGRPDDFPLMCDWDGDGLKTPGVVRGNVWYLRNSNSGGGGLPGFSFGTATDFPVCGDWNNDGIDTVGVMRGNTWFLRNANSGGPANASFTYGRAGDFPVVGDWDADAQLTETIGVVRGPSWLLRNSNSGGSAQISFTYGSGTEFPLVWR
jgi:hypothetical protein